MGYWLGSHPLKSGRGVTPFIHEVIEVRAVCGSISMGYEKQKIEIVHSLSILILGNNH